MRPIPFVRNLFCGVLFVAAACGQNGPARNMPSAELDYHAAGKLIYLPVEVNGTGPFMFCFDTGAPNSIVDTAAAQKLNGFSSPESSDSC